MIINHNQTPVTEFPGTTIGTILDTLKVTIFDSDHSLEHSTIFEVNAWWPGVKPGPLGDIDADQYFGMTIWTGPSAQFEYEEGELEVTRIVLHLLARDGQITELADITGVVALSSFVSLARSNNWINA